MSPSPADRFRDAPDDHWRPGHSRTLTFVPLMVDLPLAAAPTPNPDGPLPQGSSTGAKGSPLLRRPSSVLLRAAQPRAGAEATRPRRNADDRAPRSQEPDPQPPGEDWRVLHRGARPPDGRARRSTRASRGAFTPSRIPATPERLEAVVLRLNRQSARVRIQGEHDQVTFRSGDLELVVPGHMVTLVFERRWTWRGDSYGSGRIENPRIDVLSLGLVPLPLRGGELLDLRRIYEHYRRPDPYAPR